MREILFRGKRVDTKDWVYGYYFMGFTGIPYILVLHDHILRMTEFYEVIPETVGQFTGLTDKNGNKIFEGDIVERDYNDFYDFARYVVVFEDGAFAERCVALHSKTNDFKDISRGGYCRSSHITKEISCGYKIIGNIQDNPELLS